MNNLLGSVAVGISRIAVRPILGYWDTELFGGYGLYWDTGILGHIGQNCGYGLYWDTGTFQQKAVIRDTGILGYWDRGCRTYAYLKKVCIVGTPKKGDPKLFETVWVVTKKGDPKKRGSQVMRIVKKGGSQKGGSKIYPWFLTLSLLALLL